MKTKRLEYTLDRKRGFIYRKGRGAAVAQIVPQEDRGKDDEFEEVKLFIERAMIEAQQISLSPKAAPQTRTPKRDFPSTGGKHER